MMTYKFPESRKIFFWVWATFLICAYSLSYFFSFRVSVYSIVFSILLFMQITLSYKNRLEMQEIIKKVNVDFVRVDLLVVGYRENKEYWEKCLRSISEQIHSDINIVISVDGNEEKDQYMLEIGKQILPWSTILMNEHGGKRSAIVNAYNFLLSIKDEDRDSQYIVLVDSDTILEKDSIRNLIKCIHSDKEIGCATGNIKICNTGTFLTKVINSRYAYAFNIERSYLSYLNIMNCCSGPLSIYRKSLITRDFVERFKNQTILGNHIEPGDDRHQTLMILMDGYKSKMNPLSVCHTECPETFERFLRQQLRWMRSFYREQYWQYKCLNSQPFILSVVMTYEILFPFFILMWILCLFYFTEPSMFLFVKSFSVTVLIACIRTVFLVTYTKNLSYVYNFFYIFIYLLALLPTKMYALVSLLDNKWMTSDRLFLTRNFSLDTFFLYSTVITWNILLIYGSYHTFIFPLINK